jgi:hypothetical protein
MPDVPNATQPPEPVDFDLDSLFAEEETTPTKAPWSFRFGGERYTLPPHMDVRAMAAVGAGRLDDGLRMLLGPDQWDQLQASPKVFDTPRLKAIIERYALYAEGVSLGESSASTAS